MESNPVKDNKRCISTEDFSSFRLSSGSLMCTICYPRVHRSQTEVLSIRVFVTMWLFKTSLYILSFLWRFLEWRP